MDSAGDAPASQSDNVIGLTAVFQKEHQMDAEGNTAGSGSNLIGLAADIVAAYVSNNSIQTGDLPTLISEVHSALKHVGSPPPDAKEKPEPAVPIKKSVTPDYIISLFDGRKYKSLKRHIRTAHPGSRGGAVHGREEPGPSSGAERAR